MEQLAMWLNAHFQNLVTAASLELASSEDLRQSAEDSVVAFYEALVRGAEVRSMIPIHATLQDWVEARSAPTHDKPAGLIPVLTTLKRVTWQQIRQSAEPDQAIEMILDAEEIFADACNYLSALEAEALLDDMRRELQKAQAQVQKLDKSKSDFIAVAAHELKTPLALIDGYTNMLRSELQGSEHARMTMMLNGVTNGTARLKEIIDDMIDVTLIDTKSLTLHFQPVWLHHLITMVEFEVREGLQKRRIQLEILHDELAQKLTYGDSERLHQVFLKVISNAIKYTPDGGTITVSGRELPGFTDVIVKDSGIGIAPENLNRIFDKFSSMTAVALHSSGKLKFKGAGPGLGLAIARGVIEAHGGSIWAESPGYDEATYPGSTFHIMVPIRAAPPEDGMASLYSDSFANELEVNEV